MSTVANLTTEVPLYGHIKFTWLDIDGHRVNATLPACDDGIHNGDETDVDCGGSCPSRCTLGEGCGEGSDCGSGVCKAGVCSVYAPCPTAVDNMFSYQAPDPATPAQLAVREHACSALGFTCTPGSTPVRRAPQSKSTSLALTHSRL